jgi:F-type H+-transporting ATPase subunit a
MMIPDEGSESVGFKPGEVIIEHVANSSLDHPIFELPTVLGINFSVTKHVLMLWIVAVLLFVLITWSTRKYLKQDRPIPTGFMNALEAVVQFIRDSIVLPNVGKKFVNTWTPLVLTFFFFIVTANAFGLIPIFEVLGVVDRFILHTDHESILNRVLHGGATATGNYNVTAALALITFLAIIVAGTKAHGFIKHWKNVVPSGLAWPVYIILIPIELMGMLVKPFALTMRLAANMMGGHIAILAILSFVFIFSEMFQSVLAGVGVGLVVSLPLVVGVSALEIIIVLVQAYVFTLLTAVFIGMAINVHH